MADSRLTDHTPAPAASAQPALGWRGRWLYPMPCASSSSSWPAWLVWYVAGHWNRWTGAARFETTDDAYIAGDVTPLSAKVSGYIAERPVNDYQPCKGRPDREIDPADYRAQLAQAEANLAAAQATLANLANQKDVQRALIRQAEATIQATDADLLRYDLEAKRQRDLLQTADRRHAATRRAGRRQ